MIEVYGSHHPTFPNWISRRHPSNRRKQTSCSNTQLACTIPGHGRHQACQGSFARKTAETGNGARFGGHMGLSFGSGADRDRTASICTLDPGIAPMTSYRSGSKPGGWNCQRWTFVGFLSPRVTQLVHVMSPPWSCFRIDRKTKLGIF